MRKFLARFLIGFSVLLFVCATGHAQTGKKIPNITQGDEPALVEVEANVQTTCTEGEQWISSSGVMQCTAFSWVASGECAGANGGCLTINASGLVVCSDDDTGTDTLDDLSDDLITALSGVTTVNDGDYCQGGAGSSMDCDVTTISDGDIASTIHRDSETKDGDLVSFDDANADFTATDVDSAIEELVTANASGPNAADGKVNWEQLVNVPAGFADGSDDGAGGGGDAIEIEDGDDAGTFTAIDTTAQFDDSGDINFAVSDGGAGGPDTVTATVRTDSVALGTDTTGNYVLDVADGTGIDGTASGEGATYTPSLDLTEINSTTFGDNSVATVTHTVDPTGTTNPVWSYSDGTVNLSTGNLQEGGVDVSTGFHFSPHVDPGVDHSSYVAGHSDGANCSTSGEWPAGVDGSGAVQGCGSVLPAGASPTTDGQITWDSTAESIKVGDDGVATLEFVSGAHTTDTDCGSDTACTFTDDTWNANAIPTQYGGTGQDFSASTGVLRVSTGTASADAGVSHLASSTSADLRGVLSDESGTGAAVFAGGDVGAATATTPSTDDNDTSVATTAFVQSETAAAGDISGTLGGGFSYGADNIDGDNMAASYAGRSLTETAGTPDTLDADAELYTDTFSIVLETPATGDSGVLQHAPGIAGTITRIQCSTDTGTVDINLEERALATPNSAGTDAMAADLQCDSDSANQTSFSNAAFDANDPLALTISATASSPGWLRVHITWEAAD